MAAEPRPTRPPRSESSLDRRAVGFLLLVTSVVFFLIWLDGTLARPRSTPVRLVWDSLLEPDRARELLDLMPVVGLAPEVAYDRVADFGPAWTDVDHNGCDTRNDILRRDLTDLHTRAGTNDCVILSGALVDPYTGVTMRFSKPRANDIQIDHLVPLHAAWMLGAYRWAPATRLAYANDPRVLVAVDGDANQRKGDLLADRWRPAFRGGWCTYAVNTVAIHHDYGLPVTSGERSALRTMLQRCP